MGFFDKFKTLEKPTEYKEEDFKNLKFESAPGAATAKTHSSWLKKDNSEDKRALGLVAHPLL